jgi:hypothetical protein
MHSSVRRANMIRAIRDQWLIVMAIVVVAALLVWRLWKR